MLVPIAYGVFGAGWEHSAFYWPFFITLSGGRVLQILSRLQEPVFHQRQLFLVTAGTWLAVPLFGMLPFMFMDAPMSLVDSVFESFSGMTTTGSTVMADLDETSPDILLWRSILQWFGGVPSNRRSTERHTAFI